MSTSLANAAWPACHSALRFDRWVAGELAPAEADALRTHVVGCDRCRTALEELEQVRSEPLPPFRADESVVHRAVPPPRARRRWAAAAGALAAAAAAAGLFLLPPPEPAGTRTKGAGPALAMYVRHGGEVRRAAPGEKVAAGDAVRFAVSLREPAYVAVLSLDPAGHASVYFPEGDRAAQVKAGAEVALPLATRLDATAGEEQVFGLFCDRPLDLAPVRALVDAAAAGTGPAGCQVTRWTFVKR
ncbi:MAG TPA: DUF4384 domain-containing protein [Anaeromyxobacter sp.]|nr:DUF4384 domain-containing protein [Anaeromyxobacter sp.]